MKVPNTVHTNPNATVATLAGALTVILVWAVGVAGLTIPAEVASAATTIIAAGLLALGKRRPQQPLPPADAAPLPATR